MSTVRLGAGTSFLSKISDTEIFMKSEFHQKVFVLIASFKKGRKCNVLCIDIVFQFLKAKLLKPLESSKWCLPEGS